MSAAALDGFGWRLEKKFRLMKAYHFTERFVDWELDGDKGWALYNWARQQENSVWGSGERPASPGYLKQERERRERQNNG